MEIESVNSKANAGLTTGIIGTVGTAMQFLPQLFGGWGGFNGGLAAPAVAGLAAAAPSMVSAAQQNSIGRCEYETEMKYLQQLAQKDSEISMLKSDQRTDGKIVDLYKYIEGEIKTINNKFAEQGIFNATVQAGMSATAQQIAGLQSICAQITKTVVPNTAVCPGWGNVTITPAAATTTTPATA